MAADYSQLELRILAHLCHDRRLLQALNEGADVFRSIAAEWKMIDSEAVGDDLRQQAKQVVLETSRLSEIFDMRWLLIQKLRMRYRSRARNNSLQVFFYLSNLDLFRCLKTWLCLINFV